MANTATSDHSPSPAERKVVHPVSDRESKRSPPLQGTHLYLDWKEQRVAG